MWGVLLVFTTRARAKFRPAWISPYISACANTFGGYVVVCVCLSCASTSQNVGWDLGPKQSLTCVTHLDCLDPEQVCASYQHSYHNNQRWSDTLVGIQTLIWHWVWIQINSIYYIQHHYSKGFGTKWNNFGINIGYDVIKHIDLSWLIRVWILEVWIQLLDQVYSSHQHDTKDMVSAQDEPDVLSWILVPGEFVYLSAQLKMFNTNLNGNSTGGLS